MTISRKSFLGVLAVGAGALAFSGIMSDAIAQVARVGYRWETHKKANIKFEIPNAWVTTSESQDVLVTKPKDGGLAIEFVAVSHGPAEMKKAEDTISREILKRIPDAHVTDPAKPVAQNGLSGVVIKGQGTKAGAKVEFFAVVLGDGKGHGLLSVGFAGTGQIAAHRDQVIEIFNSIRPAA